MILRSPLFILSLAALGAIPAPALAEVDFRSDIRPLLNKHCIACHGGVKKAGGLSFLSQRDALAETKSGLHAIVPGDPGKSELLRRLALSVHDDDHMPPEEHGPPLSAAEQATFLAWIKQGAPWGEHWAYEIPRRPPLPAGKNPAWPRTDADRFVLAKLEAESLTPEPEQERARLLRRLSLDLTGRPPAAEAVKAFLADPSPDAYAKQVEALLASPAYGERWASLWLDLVRYADSKGLGQDRRRLMWQYRDWVISSPATSWSREPLTIWWQPPAIASPPPTMKAAPTTKNFASRPCTTA
jgi:hypothetical protein